MAKKQKKALGSGLAELLGDTMHAYEEELSNARDSSGRVAREFEIVELEVDKIHPNPYQPRKNFDEESLKELAKSLEEDGQIQPIVVYEDDGKYFLIAGERRLRASKIAKRDNIKAIIDSSFKSKLREIALIENIQREDLNAIELANSYQALIEEHNITHEELAKKLKKSRTQITNTLRLLQLGEYAQNLILDGKITQGHAKVMVGLSQKDQQVLADSIIGQKLSVSDTENLAKNLKNSAGGAKQPKIKRASNNEADSILDGLKELQEVFVSFGISAQISSKSVTIQPKRDQILWLIEKLKS